PAGVIGRRDYAMLLMGFVGAFRRSELAGMTAGDITRHPQDGLHVRLQRSKTDQEGRGSVRALPFGANPATCPVCALKRWLTVLAAYERSGRVGVMKALRRDTDLTVHICRGPSAATLTPD